GLCESPLTFQAIIIWRDELNEGKIFLRDIIDLEATYAGPDAKNNMNPLLSAPGGPDGQPAPAAEGNSPAMPAAVAPPAAPPAQERKYKKLKDEIIVEVKSLRLNQARIDSLVEQLYDINKKLVSFEGRLLRLGDSHGVAREDFLRNYQGSELDPRWLNRVSKLSAKGWKNFVHHEKDRIKELRHEIQSLAALTGLEI